MTSRTRQMAIALMAAILVGAAPALCAVRPTAGPVPGATDLLTPLPLVGGVTMRRSRERVLTVPLNPASEPADPGTDAGAAGWDEGNATPLLVLSGMGAFLVLLMILLASRRKPQPRQTS